MSHPAFDKLWDEPGAAPAKPGKADALDALWAEPDIHAQYRSGELQRRQAAATADEEAAAPSYWQQALGGISSLAPKGSAFERLQAAARSAATRVPGLSHLMGGPESYTEALGNIQAGKDAASPVVRGILGTAGTATQALAAGAAAAPMRAEAVAARSLPYVGRALSPLLQQIFSPTGGAAAQAFLNAGLSSNDQTPEERQRNAMRQAAITGLVSKGTELGGTALAAGGGRLVNAVSPLFTKGIGAVRTAAAEEGNVLGPESADLLHGPGTVPARPLPNPRLDAVNQGAEFALTMNDMTPAARTKVITEVQQMEPDVRAAWQQGFTAQKGAVMRRGLQNQAGKLEILSLLHQPQAAAALAASSVLRTGLPAAGVISKIAPMGTLGPEAARLVGLSVPQQLQNFSDQTP